MKLHEVVEKIGKLNGSFVKEFYKLTPEQVDKLVSEIDNMRNSIDKGTVFANDSKEHKPTPLISAEELAKITGLSRQTIYNNAQNNKIKYYKIGNSYRFRLSDFMAFHTSANYPQVLCTANTICVDKQTEKISFFKKDLHYEIVRENKIWVYLFNDKWDGAIKMGKKQFRKYFSVKGETEYDAKEYNIT